MNITEKRLQLYTLKTGLTQLELKKEQLIKAQQYEKAADIRDQQRKYQEKLQILREEAYTYFSLLDLSYSGVREKQEVFKFLIEMNPFDNAYLDPIEEELQLAKKQYREGIEEKKQRMDDLHRQRLELLSRGDEDALREVTDAIRDLNEELGNGRTINFPEERDFK